MYNKHILAWGKRMGELEASCSVCLMRSSRTELEREKRTGEVAGETVDHQSNIHVICTCT